MEERTTHLGFLGKIYSLSRTLTIAAIIALLAIFTGAVSGYILFDINVARLSLMILYFLMVFNAIFALLYIPAHFRDSEFGKGSKKYIAYVSIISTMVVVEKEIFFMISRMMGISGWSLFGNVSMIINLTTLAGTLGATVQEGLYVVDRISREARERAEALNEFRDLMKTRPDITNILREGFFVNRDYRELIDIIDRVNSYRSPYSQKLPTERKKAWRAEVVWLLYMMHEFNYDTQEYPITADKISAFISKKFNVGVPEWLAREIGSFLDSLITIAMQKVLKKSVSVLPEWESLKSRTRRKVISVVKKFLYGLRHSFKIESARLKHFISVTTTVQKNRKKSLYKMSELKPILEETFHKDLLKFLRSVEIPPLDLARFILSIRLIALRSIIENRTYSFGELAKRKEILLRRYLRQMIFPVIILFIVTIQNIVNISLVNILNIIKWIIPPLEGIQIIGGA